MSISAEQGSKGKPLTVVSALPSTVFSSKQLSLDSLLHVFSLTHTPVINHDQLRTTDKGAT